MNKLGKSLALMFVILAVSQFSLAGAQPSMVDTGIRIYSPKYVPYQSEQYENTTAELDIKVILVYGEYDRSWINTVNLDSVCYSLDGQPLVYTNKFEVEDYTDYGINQQDFLVYTALIKLENLSEGSHTVTAYANDTHNEYAYLNTLSAEYSFIVGTNTSPVPSVPEPSYLAPNDRNAPHLDLIYYLIPVSIVVAIVVLSLLFRRHRKTAVLSK